MGLYATHTRGRTPATYAVGHPSKANPRSNQGPALVYKEKVAELLIQGKTQREIAQALGFHVSTAHALCRDPDVVASIRATFEQRRNAVARELDAGVFEAVRFLRNAMNDSMNTTKERTRCAIEILDRGGIPRGVRLDIHNADTGTTVEIDDTSALGDDEIEALAREVMKRRDRKGVTP